MQTAIARTTVKVARMKMRQGGARMETGAIQQEDGAVRAIGEAIDPIVDTPGARRSYAAGTTTSTGGADTARRETWGEMSERLGTNTATRNAAGALPGGRETKPKVRN